MDEQGAKMILKVAAIVVIFIVVLAFMPFVVINAGHRGVVTHFGKVDQEVMGEGLHFYNPFTTKVYEMDVQVQKEEVKGGAGSADLQTVSFTVAVNYHLDPSFTYKIYQEIGREKDIYQRVIVPAVNETVKAATAKFTAAELLTQRPLVKEAIDLGLRERLGAYNVVTDDISIVELDFSEEFNKSIEGKVRAQQDAQKAENDLVRIKTEAQQTIETAKAEAESIRIRGEALRQNPELIDLKIAEQWNGALPQYMFGNTTPLLNLK